MIKHWAPWLLATVLLAGCQPKKPAAQEHASDRATTAAVTTPYVYTCSEYRFTARFEPEAAVLTLPDRELRLPQVLSASGARYSDGEATFWIKGDDATLEIDGKTYADCHGVPAETGR